VKPSPEKIHAISNARFMVNPIIMFFGEVATRPLYHRLVATRHLSE
jgi:hypothetical protein